MQINHIVFCIIVIIDGVQLLRRFSLMKYNIGISRFQFGGKTRLYLCNTASPPPKGKQPGVFDTLVLPREKRGYNNNLLIKNQPNEGRGEERPLRYKLYFCKNVLSNDAYDLIDRCSHRENACPASVIFISRNCSVKNEGKIMRSFSIVFREKRVCIISSRVLSRVTDAGNE